MAGIFILEGMLLSITKFSISCDSNGKLTAEGPEISVGYDAAIAWARIALVHRADAERMLLERKRVWDDPSLEASRSKVLEEEFRASMQAVVAAVTCVEALYDHLLPFSPVSNETKASWRKNRTARHIQVAETLRATLRIKPDEMVAVRHHLKAMYRLRDSSVHPSSRPRPPYLHPELNLAMDWRFTVFRGDVADVIVCVALGLLWDISQGKAYRSDELTKFMDGFQKRVKKLLPDGKPKPKVAEVTFRLP